jgi:hypothetical protein
MTLCQATLQIPREFEVPFHKTIDRGDDIVNTLWHRKKKYNKTTELKTYLIRHSFPAILKNFPFRVLNFALMVEKIGFQVESLLGLALRGNLKYMIGKVSL